MTGLAVEVIGVERTFGPTVALSGVELTVQRGRILGLLGPNGAGKTTLVRILATLLPPTSGTARVLGYDVTRQPDEIRQRIGLTGQYAAVDELLTGRENLRMFGELFHLSHGAARRRADDLLERFDLMGAAGRPARTYSGGMRRRLDLASSLITRPELLFLDEPTTGLDPRSRNAIWDVIRELVDQGTTLLLTTQHLEEADQLADRIAVIDRGRIIAEGTGDDLKDRVGGQVVEADLPDAAEHDRAAAVLAGVGKVETVVKAGGRRLLRLAAHHEGPATLARVASALHDAEIEVRDLGLRRPTLDDVFLQLTGHEASEEAAGRPSAHTQQPRQAERTTNE